MALALVGACAGAFALPVLRAFRVYVRLVNVAHITTIAVALALMILLAPALAFALVVINAKGLLFQLTRGEAAAIAIAAAPAVDAVTIASAVTVFFASVGTQLVLGLVYITRASALATAPAIEGTRALASAL